jgi:hypothetical protein
MFYFFMSRSSDVIRMTVLAAGRFLLFTRCIHAPCWLVCSWAVTLVPFSVFSLSMYRSAGTILSIRRLTFETRILARIYAWQKLASLSLSLSYHNFLWDKLFSFIASEFAMVCVAAILVCSLSFVKEHGFVLALPVMFIAHSCWLFGQISQRNYRWSKIRINWSLI